MFFRFEKKLLKNIDIWFILGFIFIFILGTLMIYSTSRNLVPDRPDYYIIRHLLAMFLGLVLFLFSSYFDYHIWDKTAKWLYFLMLALLAVVLVIGREGDYGGQSWIPLGPISLQPVEPAKIILIISLAAFMSVEKYRDSLVYLLPLLFLTAIPLGLVLLQPDLGSGLVFLAILLGLLFVGGLAPGYLLSLIGLGGAAFPFLWSRMAEYQKIRILIFANLSRYKNDPEYAKYTWQLLQSIIAIGSGRLKGKGFTLGSQTQLEFVPEIHSDMIFSALAEELGFLGSASLIILYLFVIYRIFRIAYRAPDRFGRLLAAGVGCMLLFHLTINVGMALGIMPVIGIPLPLVSYGSSNLMITLWGLGLVNSVAMRSQKTMFSN